MTDEKFQTGDPEPPDGSSRESVVGSRKGDPEPPDNQDVVAFQQPDNIVGDPEPPDGSTGQ